MNIFRKILFVSLFLAGLIALFFAEENWRGQRAWARVRSGMEAKGQEVNFQKLIPRRPADSENVFKLAPMEDWFIKDRTNSQVTFLREAPVNTRRQGQATAWIKPPRQSRYQIGIVRITQNGLPLETLDSESLYENLIGRRIMAPSGMVLYKAPLEIREIEVSSAQPLTAEKFGEKLGTVAAPKSVNAPVIVEAISSNRFALFVEPGQHYGSAMPATDFIEWSSQFEDELAVIREALKRPHVYLDGDYSRAFQCPLPNFMHVRMLAQLAASRAEAFMLVNRADEAFNELIFIEDFRRILEPPPPTLVTAMIDVAIRGLNASAIQEGFAGGLWNDRHCQGFEERFKNVNLIARELESFRKGEIPAIVNLVEVSAVDPFDKMFRVLPRGWLYQNLIEYTRLCEVALAPLEKTNGRVNPLEVDEAGRIVMDRIESVSPWVRLARIGMPNVTKATQTVAKNQNLIHQIIIASGLERHRLAKGNYPENLDPNAPHDVVTGKPFRYQARANGEYILYSPGWDLKDDLAPVLADTSHSAREIWKTEAANRDWVWRGTPELKKKSVADARK